MPAKKSSTKSTAPTTQTAAAAPTRKPSLPVQQNQLLQLSHLLQLNPPRVLEKDPKGFN